MGGLFNLRRIGKALSGQRITAEEPTPIFLEVEPVCLSRNEDVVNALMLPSQVRVSRLE